MLVMASQCPICDGLVVEISEALIRETDIVLHENEDYQHLQRGRIELLVHTKENRIAEEFLPSRKIAFA